MATATVTTDFREEYEAERGRWLRLRFLWYSGVVIGLSLIVLLIQALVFVFVEQVQGLKLQAGLQLGLGSLSTLCYVGAFVWAMRHTLDRPRMLRLVYAVILISGLISLIGSPVIFEVSRNAIRNQLQAEEAARSRSAQPVAEQPPAGAEEPLGAEAGAAGADSAPRLVTEREVSQQIARQVVLGNTLGAIFFTHFFACLFLPWTARESIRPIVPLLVVNALVSLVYVRLVPQGVALSIGLSPLIALPGMAICWWRGSRFRDRFHFQMLKGRYGEMKQELGFARQIHESMFPQPLREGPIRFEFRYEPMRQIGGDYLFARMVTPEIGRPPILNLAIVDVTGHGIGAALTVNRLHGEIERQFGARLDVRPGDLLRGMNDYLHHSLAAHSVYATALFLQIDTAENSLRWASAGHPPAFLRTVSGGIERLDSTTLVLGACRGEDFDPHEQRTRFMPGDVLIAYTDGAIEARNDKGRMLGVDGLMRIVASTMPDEEGGWASSMLRAVDAYRFGPVQDDTLMVEVFRPLNLHSPA